MSIDNRSSKIIAIIALIIGIAGVTLGYAAFSNTLTISPAAQVTPDPSTFNVDFSSSSTSVQTNPIVATLTPTGVTNFIATNGTIDNSSDPVITNLKATFTEPGQTATYTFYSYNLGNYIAYLKSIVFEGSKTCTAKIGTTQSQVDSACNGITLNVKVGSEEVTNTSVATVTNHSLGINTSEEIIVTISYTTGSALADGDFDVTLPDIVLTYRSVD